jgi:hypothetical protein
MSAHVSVRPRGGASHEPVPGRAEQKARALGPAESSAGPSA